MSTEQMQKVQANLQEQINTLEPWFHNIHLPDGTQTAPDVDK